MGPRSEERGDFCREQSAGADNFASMGPRSEERGDQVPPRDLSFNAELLQWGRALRSAEIRLRSPQRSVRQRASMGPRSEERGDTFFKIVPAICFIGFNGAAL